MHIREFVANKINLGYTRDTIVEALRNSNYSTEDIASCSALLDNVAKTEISKQQQKKKNVLKILSYIAIAAWLIFRIFIRFYRAAD